MNALPPQVQQVLDAHREALIQNYCIQVRRERNRRPVWRLRFRTTGTDGVRQHKSLHLADEEQALAVRAAIQSWRAERDQARVTAKKDLTAEQPIEKNWIGEEEQRQYRHLVRTLAGGCHDRQAAAVKLLDQALAQGPYAAFGFMMENRWDLPRGRAGRPPKIRLTYPYIVDKSTKRVGPEDLEPLPAASATGCPVVDEPAELM